MGKTTEYANKIVSGEIIAGKMVIQACQRHLEDLKRSDFYFDVDAAEHVIKFAEFLKYSEGDVAGQKIILEPWQCFIVGSIFGWKKNNGLRRFKKSYVQVSRKNSKSTLLGIVSLYALIADGESAGQVYTAATMRDQARITHQHSVRMAKSSPEIMELVKIYRDNITVPSTNSKFVPLGADADSLDGLNPSFCCMDELHASKNRKMWDVLVSAMGARSQPTLIAITTAGFNQTGICYEQYQYSKDILNNTIADETYFSYVAQIDEGDDWTDETVWIKSNPNLGKSVSLEYLQDECARAKHIPAAQNNFLTKHMDVWTQQHTVWIPLELWDKNFLNIITEEEMHNRRCYGALDLSSVSDMTSWTMAFPREDDPETLDFIYRFWCPESKLYDNANKYKDQYQTWAKQGYLLTTPGDAVDYKFIEAQVLKDAEQFNLVDMNLDRLFQGHQVGINLQQEGIEITSMGMGFVSFAAPMVEFERRILSKKMNHANHPIIRWMIGNMSVVSDPIGNLKPDKISSQGKIDGIITMIMSLDRAMRHIDEDTGSAYDNYDVREL